METEQAGLEVLSGCLGLLALVIFGIGGGVMRLLNGRIKKRHSPERRRLNDFLIDFCTGADATSVQVQSIQRLLMTSFAGDSEYEALTTTAATFAPSGRAPFHDEAWLEEKFRVFLSNQGIFVPEQAREQPGV